MLRPHYREGAPVTQVDPAAQLAVVNRIKRAQGQLAGVLRMIEEGREIEDVVTQIKAVSKALDRAGFAVIAGELRRAVEDGAVSEAELAHLEKFFLALA
jgi:DNA-binding FrmR family transcriptional regulator